MRLAHDIELESRIAVATKLIYYARSEPATYASNDRAFVAAARFLNSASVQNYLTGRHGEQTPQRLFRRFSEVYRTLPAKNLVTALRFFASEQSGKNVGDLLCTHEDQAVLALNLRANN